MMLQQHSHFVNDNHEDNLEFDPLFFVSCSCILWLLGLKKLLNIIQLELLV